MKNADIMQYQFVESYYLLCVVYAIQKLWFECDMLCRTTHSFDTTLLKKKRDSCSTCSFSLFPDWSTFRFGNKNQFFVVNE